MTDQQKITIDGVEFDLNNMSENAQSQILNMQLTDQELARLQTQIAITQTARSAYAQALKQELEGS